jgi:hypothetical protein
MIEGSEFPEIGEDCFWKQISRNIDEECEDDEVEELSYFSEEQTMRRNYE